jgi:hypothetical protein
MSNVVVVAFFYYLCVHALTLATCIVMWKYCNTNCARTLLAMYVCKHCLPLQQPHSAMHELKYLAQPFYCTISSADITVDTSIASSSDSSSAQSAVAVHPGTAAGASHFTAEVTLRIANR